MFANYIIFSGTISRARTDFWKLFRLDSRRSIHFRPARHRNDKSIKRPGRFRLTLRRRLGEIMPGSFTRPESERDAVHLTVSALPIARDFFVDSSACSWRSRACWDRARSGRCHKRDANCNISFQSSLDVNLNAVSTRARLCNYEVYYERIRVPLVQTKQPGTWHSHVRRMWCLMQRYSNRGILGDPHRSAGASRHAVHKIHPTAGGGEEFRTNSGGSLLCPPFSPAYRTAPMHAGTSTNPPLPTTHVLAFQRDVSLNARIAPGLTTLPEGEPVLSGPAAAPRRDNGVALRDEGGREGRGGGKRRGAREPAAPKLARNRLRFYHSTRFLSLSPGETSYVYNKNCVRDTHVISEVPRLNWGNMVTLHFRSLE